MATPYPVPPTVDPSSTTMPSLQMVSAAYAKIEPELAGVQPDDYVRITTDIRKSVAMGVGAIPRMVAFRAEIIEKVPQHPIELLDKLQDYGFAAWYAHMLQVPPDPGSRIQALAKEATPLRDRLLAAAQGLAFFGFFKMAKVEEIRAGTGYLDAASDLVALVGMFREKWAEIAPKALISAEELERAERLGADIMLAEAARVQPNGEPVATPELEERRLQAFTLFVNAYDACRRAIAYLRWKEGDVDEIAPSLFVRSRTRKAPERKPEAGESVVTDGGVVVPVPPTDPNG